MSAGQVVPIPLLGGLAEGIDPKQAPPGTLSLAENCIRRKSGLVEKRWGTRYLGSTAFFTTATRILIRGDELAVTDGADVWSYAALAAAWEHVGPIADVGLTWDTLLDINDGARLADIAMLSDGRLVVAWSIGDASAEVPGDVFYQIIDRSSGGSRTTRPTLVSSGTSADHIRIVVNGTDFAIVMNDTSSTNIDAWLSATGGLVTLTNINHQGYPFDAVALGARFAVVWLKTGGPESNAILVETWDFATGTPQVGPTIVKSGVTSVDSFSIDGRTGESLFIAWATFGAGFGVGVAIAVHNPLSLVQTLAPTVIDASLNVDSTVGVCRYDATTYVLMWTGVTSASGSYYPSLVQTKLVTTSGTTSASRLSWGLVGLTRPFMLGGKPYVYMGDYRWQNIAGTNSYLVAIETAEADFGYWPHRLTGIVDVLAAGEWPTPAFGTNSKGWLPNVVVASATEMLAPLPFQAQLVASDIVNGLGPVRWGVRLVSATTGTSRPPDMWRTVQIGAELYWCAGCEQAYDGVNVFDFGAHQAAIIDAAQTTSAGGGGLSAGNYLYSTVPEYRSQAGILHRGPTCPPVTVATGAASRTTLKYVAPFLSNKRLAVETNDNPMRPTVPIYRSKVNGTTLYRLTVLPTLNVSNPDFVTGPTTFLDTRADLGIGNGAVLASQAPLYTTGGELDDLPTPALYTQWLHRNRIWGILGDRRTVGFSKDFTQNVGVAPGFHPTFIFSFNDVLTAGASMDDKSIVFSSSRIWFVLGDGPARNGQNSTFEAPIKVQTDVGCTSGRSVVSMPDGIMFQSARGIYLLTRGLEVVFIGKAVQDELDAYPVVTSAVLVAAQNQVRFTCNNTAGTAGIVLVFDYLEKQWVRSKYTDTQAGTYGCPIADAAMWQGQWTFVTPTGAVFVEDTTTHRDAGTTWVPLSWAIASVAGAGPLGFQRVRKAFLLADRVTDCDLTLAFDYDDKGTFPQSYTWRSDRLMELMNQANVGMRCGSANGANPRCRSFAVRVSDAAPTGTGAVVGSGKGCTFSEVGLEIVPKPGLVRRSARARA